MEKDIEVIDIKPKNMFVPLSIVQAICVAVLLIAILIIKLGFNNSFKKVQKWCENNILEQTQITAVFDGENGEI